MSYARIGSPGLGHDYSFNDGGKLRRGFPFPGMAFDQAPVQMATDATPAAKPKTVTKFPTVKPRPVLLNALDALLAKGTNTMDDDTRKVLSGLIEFLQDQLSTPSPELDELAILVNGPTDAAGNPSAALDRRAKRGARQHHAAMDAKASAGRVDRFPNANRLSSGY